MPAVKITSKPVSTPGDQTHFLVTQPELPEGYAPTGQETEEELAELKVESLREIEMDDMVKLFQKKFAFDSEPTAESGKPVTSAGIKTALDAANAKIGELKENLTDLQELADTKAAAIYETASGEIASFSDGADDMPMKSCVVKMEPIQEGEGDPSPENVRPISGRTGLSVVRSGKNLLPMPIVSGSYDYTTVITVNDDKSFIINKPIGNGWSTFILGRFTLKPGTYTLIESDDGNTDALLVLDKVIGDTTEVLISTRYLKRKVLTVEADTLVQARYTRAGIADNVLTKLMLFVGNTATATDYEPYTGDTYSITFPIEAGTVYGGTLDVTNGKLTVDRAMVDLGTLNYSYQGGEDKYFFTSSLYVLKKPGRRNWLSSIYKLDESAFASMANYSAKGNVDAGEMYFKCLDYADATTFKTAMSGVQLVYELATPTEIQLTPQEITTLLGENNIWSDGGDVEVEYPADTKLYIEKLTSPTEDDMIADHAISANSFFMVGNTLYRATTAIASGATITIGTNAAKLSLSDALNALA